MITIKTPQEIMMMRQVGRVLAGIFAEIEKRVGKGVNALDLDKLAQDLIKKAGAKPAFFGYEGFPGALCVSLNSVVVHGAPMDYNFKPGDLVGLDLGIEYHGYFSDMAKSYLIPDNRGQSRVGIGSDTTLTPDNTEKIRFLETAKKALKLGIKKALPGNTFGDVSNTIQRYVEYQGFSVIRDLCGHGIGKELHEDPKILNFGKRGSGAIIQEGMVFCLEPMIAMGDWKLEMSSDGFGWETVDKSLTCHFEHTLAIVKNKVEVLTKFK
jgi:methionyl aminopeptidase